MNSKPRSVLIALLILATLGSAGLAWQQYRALTRLRIASGNPDSNSDLQQRLTEAEHRAHDLENELAALKARNEADAAFADDSDRSSPPPGDRNQGGPRNGQRFQSFFGNLDKLMQNPEFAKLINAQEKAGLDGRYASLFKELSASGTLTPQQVEAFKDLLVEKQNAARDARLAAQSNGITDRAEIRLAAQNAQAEVDKQIQTQLGDAAYQQYKNYEQTAPQRNTVNQLSQRLSYSSTPLSDPQSQQLIQILANNSSGTDSNNNRRATMGFGGAGLGGFGGGVTITDTALTKAQPVLTPPQFQALTDLQKLQIAQADLTKALRNANPVKQVQTDNGSIMSAGNGLAQTKPNMSTRGTATTSNAK